MAPTSKPESEIESIKRGSSDHRCASTCPTSHDGGSASCPTPRKSTLKTHEIDFKDTFRFGFYLDLAIGAGQRGCSSLAFQSDLSRQPAYNLQSHDGRSASCAPPRTLNLRSFPVPGFISSASVGYHAQPHGRKSAFWVSVWPQALKVLVSEGVLM